MSIADKLTIVSENMQKVYTAGQTSMVDESKIVPKTVSGTSISVDDVSEIPHDVSCKVESLNLANLSPSSDYGIEITLNDDGSYTISGTATTNTILRFGNVYKISASQIYASSGSKDMGLDVQVNRLIGVSHTMVYDKVVGIPCEGTTGVMLVLPIQAGVTYDAVIRPMISLYDYSTFTPYIFPETIKVMKYGEDESEGYQELTPNADGTVVGIKSTSPYMNVISDTEGVILTATYNKSWGMQYEYDRVWDDFQQNGNRTYYNNYFIGRGWVSGTTYNPKYPITCTANGATAMFNGSPVTDTLVPITISGANASVFYGSSIVTIRLLILGSGLTTMNDWFNNMTKLENITVEGEIPLSTSFAQSTKLTARSMVNIVEHLSSSVTGKTLTFNSDAVANADWSSTNYSSFDELIATKTNWTIGV